MSLNSLSQSQPRGVVFDLFQHVADNKNTDAPKIKELKQIKIIYN